MFAKVVVDVASSNTDDLFTYHIPDEFQDIIFVGSKVFVEFGFRKVIGYVLDLSDDTNYNHQVKDVLEVIDFEQGLTLEQIDLAKKIAKETKCYLISALELMYPSFMKSKIRKYLNIINYDKIDGDLALSLGHRNKILINNEILKSYKKIKKEIDKGNIEIISDIYTYGKRKTIKYYRLKQRDRVKSSKRQEVINFLNNRIETTLDEIQDHTEVSEYLIKKMVDDKILEVNEKPLMHEVENQKKEKNINFDFDEQQLVNKYNQLDNKPFLLFSNDERFKLDFYLKIAIEVVKEGKQVLIVTPTILHNTIIYKYFLDNLEGYRVFSFSSRLTNNEYYYQYQNVKEQNVDIVISTKSSIFLPLDKLGLIIMVDEENNNYLNEQNPKFSVLEALKFRSEFHHAKLVLSSSSPSIVNYYQYTTAKFYLLEKTINTNNNISLVNIRENLDDLLLSDVLKQKLGQNLRSNHISLLVLNSLGYSPLIMCSDCMKIIKCPKCKINITYHKQKDIYKCNYCNEQFAFVKCECEKTNLTMLGYGLEKLKERLLELYPEARICQVDSTTMQAKTSYEDLLVMIEENEVDIIIGTLIVTPLINHSINLVGIINADSILNFSDYRSSEICYQIISSAKKHNQLIIQGYNIDHYAIKDAIYNQYEDFFKKEIEVREDLTYPPFKEINRLLIIGDYQKIYYYANYFKKIFHRTFKGECLGPVYLNRIRGIQLIIKHSDYDKLSTLIDDVNNKFKDDKLIVNFERYPINFY